MNRPDRKSILCIGLPGSGKTALTLRITDWFVDCEPGIDSTFVLDIVEQFSTGLDAHVGDLEAQLELLEADDERVRAIARSRGLEAAQKARTLDGPICRNIMEFARYCGLLAEARESKEPRLLPRRVIWRCGPKPEAYGFVFAEACNIGNVAIVACESKHWWPPFKDKWPIKEIPGRPDVTLEALITMGRAHIRNRHGHYCPVHLVLDAQMFALLHWEVRQSTLTVLCSRLEGGEAYATINREFGDGTGDLAGQIRQLEPHEWLAVRGRMPQLAPFRGGGR